MNVFDWWSGKNGTVGFAVTNMDWKTFSKESHEFQCGDNFGTNTKHLTPTDFQNAMRKKGYEITVYVPTECADWWCDN